MNKLQNLTCHPFPEGDGLNHYDHRSIMAKQEKQCDASSLRDDRNEIIDRLQSLQDQLTSLQAGQVRLLNELAAQGAILNKVEQEARHGRWWRRLGLLLRILLVAVLIAAALYLAVDWQAFFQFFV
jgi:hypothetical protein